MRDDRQAQQARAQQAQPQGEGKNDASMQWMGFHENSYAPWCFYLVPLNSDPQPVDERATFALVLKYHPIFLDAVKSATRLVPVPCAFPFRLLLSRQNFVPCIASVINRTNKFASSQVAQINNRVGVEGSCFLFSTINNECNLGTLQNRGLCLARISFCRMYQIQHN